MTRKTLLVISLFEKERNRTDIHIRAGRTADPNSSIRSAVANSKNGSELEILLDPTATLVLKFLPTPP